MPRFPEFANRVKRLPASVFEQYRDKMQKQGYQLVKLHIGDTYMHPNYKLPIDPEFQKKHPFFNRYCNTFGVTQLRRALLAKVQEDNQISISGIDNILVTNGATNALSASAMSLLNPGEDMLVLTPCWPFFPGMVKMAGGNVIEVPFYHLLYENSDMNIADYFDQYLTSDTAAIYLNTPNNPSGKVLNRDQLQQIADYAKEHRLWIISDEAYDGLTFDGFRNISIATFPGVFEQTISIFTFSKSFMFSGLRLGFLVAAETTVKTVNKIMLHQLYSPATISQYMMLEPVKQRHSWIPQLREKYQKLRDLFLKKLAFEVTKPEGTYFLFFSINEFLKQREYREVIDELLEAGVSVAPGSDFGRDFADYIRICFTGEPMERLELAVERLNKVLTG